MQLLLRVETGAPETCEAFDLVLEVEPAHSIAEVTAAITGHIGGSAAGHRSLISVRAGRVFDPDETIDTADLVSGDVVRVVGGDVAVRRAPAEPAIAVTLAVVGGPDAGRSMLLAPGSYRVGRHPACDIVVDDLTVSRRHAHVTVGDDWHVVVSSDVGASQPVLVNGEPIEGAVPVGDDDLVTVGHTRLALRRFECAELRRNDHLGQVEFQRTPYRPPVVAERPTESIGPVPRRPDTRRLQLLAVLAPLAAGLMMYAFTRQLQFLALTLVSPVVMIANAVDDRKSGRRTMRDDIADFRDRLVHRRHDLERLRAAERADRWRSAPDLADLLQRASRRSIDLWSRSRGAPDFLQLRLGLGSAPTAFAIEIERGGDDDLRGEAMAAVDGLDVVDDVPVTVDLVDAGVFGVHGREALVDGVVSSLVVQAACLHSPDDLTIVAAIAGDRPFGWMKWLPHLRSVTSPVAGPHRVSDTEGADRLVAALLEVVAFRQRDGGFGRPADAEHWPRIVAVLDAGLGADPAEVARLVDQGPAAGISVVWMAPRPADVPHQATAVLAVTTGHAGHVSGTLWSTDPDVPGVELEVEPLLAQLAERAARALAPVRDASTASLATSIPRSVDLLDAIGADTATARGITERWLAPQPYGLAFPIGMGATGVVELDLVHDGPHALIGGTSGAGKSELLQSMVASLASRYSSRHLNFLFVDYKGGAASKTFERLPHTVGYVTNLSADLALRALTSLRAELNHRMMLMEGRAKDLEEMRQVAPDEAPPSLVIIVDEFATLTKEVPEFVAGMIDVAQRGRSLGIHLVLATQRPSGAVNENILANTNMRISLRMLDRAESTAVIGSPEAADIPVPLRGRAFARLGAQHLVPFQSAYSAAPVAALATAKPVLVGAFDGPHAMPRRATSAPAAAAAADGLASTQLGAVIDAIVAADEALRFPAPRRPWCDALPDVVELADVAADPRTDAARATPGRMVAIGLLDAPERQEQRPFLVHLEEGGGWMIFGSGGAGKTTVLRSVATSVMLTASPSEVAVLGFDFASRGLSGVRPIPNVIDVATGDDLEAVTRHLVTLDRELGRRRAALAAANAEHLTAYNSRHTPMARVVVLIDGFGGMVDALSESGGGLLTGPGEAWVDRLLRIIIDGRQVGIHAVIAAERRNAVPTRLHAAVSNRLVLRHAEESAYSEHGIGPSVARSLDLGPGRGLANGLTLVQIAVPSGDASARGQIDAIEQMADAAGGRRTDVLESHPLPERLCAADIARQIAGDHVGVEAAVAIGMVDVTGETAAFDLRWSHALVVGPPRSGRSTALATIALGLAEHYDVHCVGSATSGLAAAGLPQAGFGRADAVVPVLDRLANLLAMGPSRRPVALVVDDLDALDDPMLAGWWDRLLAYQDLRIVAAVESSTMSGFTTNPLLVQLKRARRQLVLCPDDGAEFMQMTGVRLPHRPGVAWKPGRGVLLVDRMPQVVQVAVTSPVGATADHDSGRVQRQISVPA